MSARTVAIALGIALAVSVAVNVFAGAAALTALKGPAAAERPVQDASRNGRRPSTRELVAALDPDVQPRVREALRDAALAARPDFQAAREARREAVAAASAEPMDAARVAALLEQSRAAEARGRARLEADAVAIIASLDPADRASFARILNNRGKGKGDRSGERRG